MESSRVGTRLALAGMVCGALSLIAGLVGAIFAQNWVPGFTSGAGVLLIVGAVPFALAGLVLSLSGRRSAARRRVPATGIALSALALVPFCVLLVVFYNLMVYCHAHGCFV